MRPHERHGKNAAIDASLPDPEGGTARLARDLACAPVGTVGRAKGEHTAFREASERCGLRAVCTQKQEPAPRHQVDQPAKRRQHRFEVVVDIGVVEFDVVDDGDVGQILQELGGLIEKRTVVFVSFDHKRRAGASNAVTGSVLTEIARDTTDKHRRVYSAMREQPPSERRGRRLSVRAGNHDRAGVPKEMLSNGLRQRHVTDLAVQVRPRALDSHVIWRCRSRQDRSTDRCDRR